MPVDPLLQMFVDRALDEVVAFHRDERKYQVRELRDLAKMRFETLPEALKLRATDEDKIRFVQDSARSLGREYLSKEYAVADVMNREITK